MNNIKSNEPITNQKLIDNQDNDNSNLPSNLSNISVASTGYLFMLLLLNYTSSDASRGKDFVTF